MSNFRCLELLSDPRRFRHNEAGLYICSFENLLLTLLFRASEKEPRARDSIQVCEFPHYFKFLIVKITLCKCCYPTGVSKYHHNLSFIEIARQFQRCFLEKILFKAKQESDHFVVAVVGGGGQKRCLVVFFVEDRTRKLPYQFH